MNTMLRAGSLALILSAASFMTPTIAVAKTYNDTVPQAMCAPRDFHRNADGEYDGCKTSGGSKSSRTEQSDEPTTLVDGEPMTCKQIIAEIYDSAGTVAMKQGAFGALGGGVGGAISTRNYPGNVSGDVTLGGALGGLISSGGQSWVNQHMTRKQEIRRCELMGPKRYIGSYRD